MIKVAYTDANRNSLIASMPEKILVGDARHTDEKYLLFVSPEETEPYVLEPELAQPTEIDHLKQRITALESKVVTLDTSVKSITGIKST